VGSIPTRASIKSLDKIRARGIWNLPDKYQGWGQRSDEFRHAQAMNVAAMPTSGLCRASDRTQR
jgi:hypothetical protein